MDVQATITAVTAAAETVAGLRGYDHPPASASVPALVVGPADGQFLTYDSSSGSHDLMLTGLLLVSEASDRAGWSALNGFLAPSGSGSVKAAIEADQDLGNVAHYVAVTAASGVGLYEVGGQQYYGTKLSITVGCY